MQRRRRNSWLPSLPNTIRTWQDLREPLAQRFGSGFQLLLNRCTTTISSSPLASAPQTELQIASFLWRFRQGRGALLLLRRIVTRPGRDSPGQRQAESVHPAGVRSYAGPTGRRETPFRRSRSGQVSSSIEPAWLYHHQVRVSEAASAPVNPRNAAYLTFA